MKKISSKQEGTFALISAIFVLFSAMLNPLVSVSLAIIALSVLSFYHFSNKKIKR